MRENLSMPQQADFSPVHSVPDGWNILPLFALMRERKEKNIGNKVSEVLSLSYGKIIYRDTENNFGLLPESFETYQIVEPGNIVLRLTDLQNDKRSLRVGQVKFRGIITSAYVCLEPVNILSEYVYYLLHSYDLNKVFYSIGGGVRQSMKYEDLKRLPIILPPEDKQRTIADFLDRETARIDELIAKKQRQIELLQEKRAAVISHAVTKGLNPDAKMKDSGIEWLGEIPEHWAIAQLKHVTKVQNGLTLGKKYDELELTARPYLRVANVQDGYLALEDIAEVELPKVDTGKYELKQGDVLMTEGGDFDKLGRGYVWEDQIPGCLHQNHIFAVRPNPRKLDSYFLGALISSLHGKHYFTSTSSQTTNLATTNSTKLGSFPTLLPPTNEQKLIVEKISTQANLISRTRDAIASSIATLREYRSALISAAVTGKIDVRKEAAA